MPFEGLSFVKKLATFEIVNAPDSLIQNTTRIVCLCTGGPHKQCVCLCSKYKEMYGRILKSLNIVNLYQEMFKLKLKINVKVPQLLCIVVSVALNGKFERFGGFCVGCCYTLYNE